MLWALLALAVSAQPAHHRSGAVLAQFQRENPCPATGRPYGPCPGWVKDHVEPLCAGGPDRVENLQWQELAESKVKDRAERRQCREIRKSRAKP